MSEERVGDIVDLANAQKPDLTVLLGDYVCTHRFVSGYVPPSAWAEHWPGSRRRSASMQFWAITTGCRRPFQPSRRITLAVSAGRWRKREFRCSKINRCVCPARTALLVDRAWRSAGAPVSNPPHGHGAADLPAAMREMDDDAPAILLVHEPYFFPWVPDRIALTLAGDMHGGQVNLPIIGGPVAGVVGIGLA